MADRSVVILAPNSFARFEGPAVESQFQLLIKDAYLASLHNLDLVFNSPLVNPRLDNGFRDSNPMAGYYLESFLKRYGFDAQAVFNWSDDTRLKEALSSDPIAIALSTTYITDNRLLAATLRAVRAVSADVPIIVGGPYIWKQKIEFDRDSVTGRSELEEAQRFGIDVLGDCLFGQPPQGPIADAVYIAHEFGEYTLLKVLRRIEEGKAQLESLSDIPNLMLPVEGRGWHVNAAEAEPIDLENDYTRWDLISDMPSMVPIRASVGCPYKCRYCDFIELHPRIRMRTAASIAAEIDLAKRRSGRFFAFVDDNIFLSKRRIAELTDILLGQSMGIAWGGFFRVDRIDESNVDALAESGCRFGLCGIESLDESQLGRMRKNCNPAEVVRGIDLATSVGMNLNLSLLVGYPGETRGSIDNTIEALNRLELTNKGFASWLAYPLYVLPGTAVDRVEYRRQFNLVGRRAEWIHDTMSAEEAGSYWSNYLYEGIEGLPYHYYAGDVPSFWSVDRRQRGFGARRELTRCFLAGKSDEGIQRSFDRLYREIRDGAGGADIPAWQTVLEERSRQPGARERYRGAF